MTKTFTRNFMALAVGAALSLVQAPALANLYREGTQLHAYVESLDDYIPRNMEIVFVNLLNRDQFISDLDMPFFEGNRPLQVMVETAYSEGREPGHNIYTKILFATDYGANKDVCMILSVGDEHIAGSHMHEMMHCIARSTSERADMAIAIAPVMQKGFKAPGANELPTNIKTNRVLEVHAHILADIIMRKTGLTSDKPGQLSRINSEYPKSVGKISTARGIELCRESRCSTDASTLMQQLMRDELFVEALKLDLATVSAYIVKTGNFR